MKTAYLVNAHTGETLTAAALCLHYAESYESLTAKLQKTLDHNDKRIAIE